MYLGVQEQGKRVHEYLNSSVVWECYQFQYMKRAFAFFFFNKKCSMGACSPFLGSSLTEMYATCGELIESLDFFYNGMREEFACLDRHDKKVLRFMVGFGGITSLL